MPKSIPFILFVLLCSCLQAQELYVVTEPASNMPAGSLAFRMTGSVMKMEHDQQYHYRLEPQIRIGLDKKWMIQLNGYSSDMFRQRFHPEGAGLYSKYRFFSSDNVHTHFRLAAFGKISFMDNPDTVGHSIVHDYGGGILHLQHDTYTSNEIDLDGNNSGFNAGFVATQLLNRLAISASTAYTNRWSNGRRWVHPGSSNDVLNYSLSAGYLLLPQHYDNYHQTNVNLYLEFLGASSLDARGYYIDAVPALQFIFNSIARLDLACRTQVKGNIARFDKTTWILRLEYNLLNAFRRKK